MSGSARKDNAPARMRALPLIIMMLLATAVASPAHAEGGCADGIRGVFQKVTKPMRIVREAVHDFLHRKGRAQAEEVQRILNEKAAQDVGLWEEDVVDRMGSKKTYPRIEELLALMAARSPTFKTALVEFLQDRGAIRFRVLAHLFESVRTFGKKGEVGGGVTRGRRLWELWQTRIRLPARRPWTPDDLHLFLTEMSDTMFRALHPQPGFTRLWAKAFFSPAAKTGKGALSDVVVARMMRAFAERLQNDYRGRYRAFMDGVSLEAYGKPRPEVLRDFYHWGLSDTIHRRLAAVISERKLGAAFDRDVLFRAEVEKLSFEVMFFTRPVISALVLYWVLDPVYGFYEMKQERQAFEKDVKEHPDKYMKSTARVDADRMKNFEEQIEQLTIQKRQLESELAQSPPLPATEAAMRQKLVDKINKRLGILQELKLEEQRKETEIHP